MIYSRIEDSEETFVYDYDAGDPALVRYCLFFRARRVERGTRPLSRGKYLLTVVFSVTYDVDSRIIM